MESPIESMLAQAVTLHREGSLARAAALYAEILEANPVEMAERTRPPEPAGTIGVPALL